EEAEVEAGESGVEIHIAGGRCKASAIGKHPSLLATVPARNPPAASTLTSARYTIEAMADPATLLRALKLARVPGKTVAEACARFGVSRGAYQKAKRDRRAELAWTDDELVLSGLVYFGGGAGGARPFLVVAWVEYSVYRPAA